MKLNSFVKGLLDTTAFQMGWLRTVAAARAFIRLYHAGHSSRFSEFAVLGPAEDHGNYFMVPVSPVADPAIGLMRLGGGEGDLSKATMIYIDGVSW